MNQILGNCGTFCCSLCGKSAKSEESRRRHEYYCRSKSKTKSTLRRHGQKRSCDACVKAKTRCKTNIHASGSCERCRTKHITCHYVTPSEGGSSNNNVLVVSQPSIPLMEESHDSLHPQYNLENLEEFSFNLPLDDDYTASNMNKLYDIVMPSQAFEFPPNSPSNEFYGSLSQLNSFERKPLHQAGAIAISSMAIGVLRAIPAMMRRRATFPAFIHPRCYGSENDGWKLPVSLANVVSIAQMFHQRNDENRDLIWRTIHMEQKRLLAEYAMMEVKELLAAMQSLLVYALMRIVDGPTNLDGFDTQLTCTIQQVCTRMSKVGDFVRKEELLGQRIPWAEWIVLESRRRASHVLRVALYLFNMDINILCRGFPRFVVAPLPASKVLWRAGSAEEWEGEWEKEVKESSIHGMLKNGDLVKLKRGLHEAHQKREDWAHWYAGADELGILIVLSASLN